MRVLLIITAFFLSSTVVCLHALELNDFSAGRGRNWDAIKLLEKGDREWSAGNLQAARSDIDAAIRTDPTLWVAIFWRARLSADERKWDLVVRDCNAVLRQDSTFVEAAVLRAKADIQLGRYAASLRDLNDSIRLQPSRLETYSLALNRRAWLRATCPDASIRNGRAAVDDAKKACNIRKWKEANFIDTLAAASAEAGDFDSAVRYEEQAMKAPDANEMSRSLEEHMAMFKQHRPIRMK
jgi:tetratricopeptide (TPR) repeat protein